MSALASRFCVVRLFRCASSLRMGAPMPRVDYAGVASYTSYRHRQARTLPALRRSLFIDPCNAAAHLSCLRALKCAHFDWTTAWRCRVIAASAHQYNCACVVKSAVAVWCECRARTCAGGVHFFKVARHLRRRRSRSAALCKCGCVSASTGRVVQTDAALRLAENKQPSRHYHRTHSQRCGCVPAVLWRYCASPCR